MSVFLKKTALTPQLGLVSKSLDPVYMFLVELLICISMQVHQNTEMWLTYSFIRSFIFLSLFPPSLCLSYSFITLFTCLLLPVFFPLYLPSVFLSYFNYSLCVCVCVLLFPHLFHYSLLLVVSYLFSSSSLYFLPIFFHVFLYIFLTFISFFLFSDTLFLPSFINVG